MTDKQRGSSRHSRRTSAHSPAQLERSEPAHPCVVVLGSDRDYIASMEATLAGLGVAGPRTPPGVRGSALGSFNEDLLRLLGASWDRPPLLERGWELSAALDDRRQPARVAFGVAFRGREAPVAWVDPLLCLLLPFWRAVLDRPLVAVLCTGDAAGAAGNLPGGRATTPALGLALYDRYQRSALGSLPGLPVFVASQRSLAEEADGGESFLHSLTTFLRSAGVKVGDPIPASGSARSPKIRAPRAGVATPAREGQLLLPGLVDLRNTLDRLPGPHESFVAPQLTEPDNWIEELLAARSEAIVVWRGLEWTARQLATIRSDMASTRSVAAPVLEAEEAQQAREADDLEPLEPEVPAAPGYPLNATQDQNAYHRWLKRHNRPVRLPGREETPPNFAHVRPRTSPPRGESRPLISIVVPVYRPPLWALVRCITSVLEQDFASYELCLCDDASGDENLSLCLEEAAALDPRVKFVTRPANGGISAASNAAIALASGDFLAFLDNDDELAPHALSAIAAVLEAEPRADVVYSDEDKLDEDGHLSRPAFKPSWSPDTLLSCAYMCHLLVVRAALVAELSGLRSELDGSQDYDLMLRATERAAKVVHVPDVLYHWRTMSTSAASGDASVKPWAYEAGRRALADAMERRGEPAHVDGDTTILGTYRVVRQLRPGLRVSVIVPFRDEPALLTQCVDSVLEAPGVEDIELCLIDNGSVLPETEVLLDQLSSDPHVLLLEEPGPFNWSAINNAAAAHASGDLLLFMNNDVEATTAGWMAAMAEHAQRDGIGAVGARLLYPNRTIQHAGIVLGMGGIAAHVLQDLPEDNPGYLSWAFMIRNCLAVTGACLMTRRDVFEELGGFAEDLPIAFNDVDFCLRIAESGRHLVYTPYAELVHHESRTRGHTDDALEFPRFLRRWRACLQAGDPYYHPSLSLWRQHCTLATPEEEKKWQDFLLNLERMR